MRQCCDVVTSGDRELFLNYRPISLTSIFCKIMKYVVYSHLIYFLDYSYIIHPKKHGFRKHLPARASCVNSSQICIIISTASTEAILIDFAKVFDTLPHQRLLLNFRYLNFNKHVLGWIASFLSNRYQVVSLDNTSSFLLVRQNMRSTEKCFWSTTVLNLCSWLPIGTFLIDQAFSPQ